LDAYSTVFSELRYAILGRLLAAPATLPVLLRDLRRAAELGVIPGGFTVADVVGEVKLYTRLGLVAEADGLLWAVREALPEPLRGRVERLAVEFARVLGLEPAVQAAAGVRSVEALA
jgi:hypothetical protein